MTARLTEDEIVEIERRDAEDAAFYSKAKIGPIAAETDRRALLAHIRSTPSADAELVKRLRVEESAGWNADLTALFRDAANALSRAQAGGGVCSERMRGLVETAVDAAFEAGIAELEHTPGEEEAKAALIAAIAQLEANALTARAAPEWPEIYVGNGKFAICDWSDWQIVRGYKWRLSNRNHSGLLYVQAWSSEDVKTRKRITMHRLIMGDASTVDHINGNGLDNRRANLRSVNAQQNSWNQKSHGGSSKYKGVSFDKETGLWRAYITKDGRRKTLGRFGSEDDAASVYNDAARMEFGEYAKLNEVE